MNVASRASVLVLSLFVSVGASPGCAIVPHFALLYSEVGQPMQRGPLDHDTDKIHDKDFEVLGPAHAVCTVQNYLGLVAVGTSGIATAYDRALKSVPGAEMLIDVYADTETTRVMGFYLKETLFLRATAIKFKRP